MRFVELLTSAGITPLALRGDTEVTSVQCDSRRCSDGACFVAVEGNSVNGHEFIPSAISSGGAAIVCEDNSSVPRDVSCAVVGDTHAAAGRLAQAIRGWPVRKLTNVAVTGTNGKSTVTHLIRAAAEGAGLSPAVLGTIAYETGVRSTPAVNTTPDPIALAEMTEEMAAAGRTHLVMEVSSHALDQSRTAGIEFPVAVFTNLSGDHLDYHETMERYCLAKRRLFEQLGAEATAVINRDDPAGETMAAATGGRVCWYGLSRAADIHARIDHIDARGTRFMLICAGERLDVFTPLIGRHNVMNCLASAGACVALGIDLPTIAAALESVRRVPGRLERVDAPAPFQVFVDYAHTDDALTNVVSALRPLTNGRIILVFGCGGQRDRSKRPRMARVAEDLADRVIITSDNPRNEDPQQIIDEIIAGLSDTGRRWAQVQPDRREAIRQAIDQACDGDVVLIAGKGHEQYQVVGTERLDFSDAAVAGEMMRQWRGGQ